MSTQTAILWPDHYTPGTTSNFVSNETIAPSIRASQIWSLLHDISKWESYYKNCAQVAPPSEGPQLDEGRVFKFSTFGFPQLTCTVRECVTPEEGKAGRLAWESRTDEGLEIYHAWVVEDLEGGRVRVLTQESQNGPVSADWAVQKPNKMLLGHQDWLDGLVNKVRGEKITDTNLEKIDFPVRQLDEKEVK